MTRRDTIAAIATAQGRAGVGVVRVSGQGLASMAQALTRRGLAPRHATLVTFHDARGEPIDQGLALYFPHPSSYTGEDVLELHGHGGPVVLRRLLEQCLELGARIAEPGEFTRRAFLNGKLDLVQAESVIDLIDATSTEAARSAMRSLRGEFSSAIGKLTRDIVEMRALIEATLDFPEEELDGPDLPLGSAERLPRIICALDEVVAAARRGSVLREGLHIALAGQPNVGKSSLINRLAGEDLAIVTDIPGTTRDAIRQTIDLDGMPAHIADTAGLRQSQDPVERIGVERAWGAIRQADLVLLIADARTGLGDAERDILSRIDAQTPRVIVMNKIDLVPRAVALDEDAAHTTVWLSAKSGEGLELLRGTLIRHSGWHGGEGVFLARGRHLEALNAARKHLVQAVEQPQPELIAEELRRAHAALGAITGAYTADDLLGEIFTRFCIGK